VRDVDRFWLAVRTLCSYPLTIGGGGGGGDNFFGP